MSFRKNKKSITILKLFKTVSYKEAKDIQIKKIVDAIFEMTVFDEVEVNYGQKEWKNNKFDIENFDFDQDVVDFRAWNTHSGDFFDISNSILNQTDNQTCNCFSLSIGSQNLDKWRMMNNLIYVGFNYGYIVELGDNYDFESERKIKKCFFTVTIDVKEIDVIWSEYVTSLMHGYFLNLYKENILNFSHLEKLSLIGLRGVGQFKEISDKLILWSLTESEYFEVKKMLRRLGLLLKDKKSLELFMDSPESKLFYRKKC